MWPEETRPTVNTSVFTSEPIAKVSEAPTAF